MILYEISQIPHKIKNLWKRWRYGAGCCDTFSLDYFLAKRIINPLKEFRKKTGFSHPCDFESTEEWEKALDEMIWAFEFLLSDEEIKRSDYKDSDEWFKATQQAGEREQKGFELFGKHFRSLWI